MRQHRAMCGKAGLGWQLSPVIGYSARQTTEVRRSAPCKGSAPAKSDDAHRSCLCGQLDCSRHINNGVSINSVLQRDPPILAIGIVIQFDAGLGAVKHGRGNSIISGGGKPSRQVTDMRVQPENFLQHDNATPRRFRIASNKSRQLDAILGSQLNHFGHGAHSRITIAQSQISARPAQSSILHHILVHRHSPVATMNHLRH